MKILYQGNKGAYSHLAAVEIFPDAKVISCNIEDLLGRCFLLCKLIENIKRE